MALVICSDCGLRQGKKGSVHAVTWQGECSWCGEMSAVTDPVVFYVPKDTIDLKRKELELAAQAPALPAA